MSENNHNSASNLQSFVLKEYEKQKEGRSEKEDNLDPEVTASFYSRALGECVRMNGEVDKSHAKMAKLHNELGADTFDAWRKEHASEVLTLQQRQAVERAHEDVPS